MEKTADPHKFCKMLFRIHQTARPRLTPREWSSMRLGRSYKITAGTKVLFRGYAHCAWDAKTEAMKRAYRA